MVSGCASVLEKQETICNGTAYMGDHKNNVMINDVPKQNNQTQYLA
ncbi:phage exclusion lipoprotein Cor, partial [Enterobacter intestinihominis]